MIASLFAHILHHSVNDVIFTNSWEPIIFSLSLTVLWQTA